MLRKTNNIISALIVTSLLVLASLLDVTHNHIGMAAPASKRLNQIEELNQHQYLPFVVENFPSPPTPFGAEILSLSSEKLNITRQAYAFWVRNYAFSWQEIEPERTSPATYRWEFVKTQGLQEAAAQGQRIIATVRNTPLWAQKLPGVACGPVAEDALDEFGQFMYTLVRRYGYPPYNIKYWEIGNEPDVAPGLVPPDSPYGCWGDADDQYYGGGYYAQMLSVVYPQIKAADPYAKVMIGGLLLDCDPTHPPPGKDCKPSKFLEGILRNQGAAYFDIVSYHGYVASLGGDFFDKNHPGWSARGGVLDGKISFLREVMANYGVNKPLMLTEASLVCPVWSDCHPAGDDFYEDQADFVVQLYARSWSAGLLGTIWFALEDPGWSATGLLRDHLNPKPVYLAYQYMAQKLVEARIGAQITQYPRISGYEFLIDGGRTWVLWATDRQDHSISLPIHTTNVFDKYGNPVDTGMGTVIVNSPIYIDLTP